MQKLKNFKQFELVSISQVYAGTEIATGGVDSVFGCDTHHDDNGNGEIDPGECVVFIDC